MPSTYDCIKVDGKADGNRVARKHPDTLFVGTIRPTRTGPAKGAGLIPRNGLLDTYLVGNLAAILDLCAKKHPCPYRKLHPDV